MFAIIALAASAASQIAGAVSNVNAARRNERAANRLARDVLERGEFDAMRYGLEAEQVVGAQRAAFGAAGVDVNVGSPAQIRAETENIAARDIAQIRLNAEREAWGIRTQARNATRAAVNSAWAMGIGAGANFLAQSGVGETLLNRGQDAWQNWQGRRTLNRAANRGTFADPSWF